MKTTLTRTSLIITILLLGVCGYSQGTFVNLGFENPILPLDPNDPSGVPISNALPGWTGYIGANQIQRVFYNTISIGGAAVSLQGPGSLEPVLQGSYTVFLQAQFSPTFPSPVSAAIAQTGQIPSTAQSLVFLGRNISLQVTFRSQVIPYYVIGNGPDYTTYGGNISGFAGQTGELRFTGFNFGGDSLDAISFAPQAIPEPGMFGLLGFSASILGWRLRGKPKQ